MIARRKTNLHLPPRMYIYEGRRKTTFYTITHQNKRINLGHDFLEAKRQLLELEQNKQSAGTIGEFMEWYLQHVSAKKSRRTHKDEQASMQRLKAVFGKLFFSELKPHHIAKWHDMRGEDAPIRANREKSLLSHVCSIAVRKGEIDINPCRDIARHPETQRDRFVTDAELESFCKFAMAQSETGRMLALTARLAYLTSQRKGDLLRLRLDQISDQGIYFKQAKTSAKLLIEWTPALTKCVNDLRALPRPVMGMFLICNRSGQPYTDSGFKAMWGRTMTAWADQGNERFHFHDLRAKAITKMVEEGRRAEDISGHADARMVKKVYDRRRITKGKATE